MSNPQPAAGVETQMILSALTRLDSKMDNLSDKVGELQVANAYHEAVRLSVNELKVDVKDIRSHVTVLEKGAIFIRGGIKTLTAAGALITFFSTALYHLIVIRGFLHKG